MTDFVSLYRKYQNIIICMRDYRKYEVLSPKLEEKEFRLQMGTNKYVTISCKFPQDFRVVELRNIPITVIMTGPTSTFHTKMGDFRTLHNVFNKTHYVILVGPQKPTDILKDTILALAIENSQFFQSLTHTHFATIYPKVIGCYLPELISKNEYIADLGPRGDGFKPRMHESEMMCIWAGGIVGEIAKTTRISPNAKLTISFREIVAPFDKRLTIKTIPDNINKINISEQLYEMLNPDLFADDES